MQIKVMTRKARLTAALMAAALYAFAQPAYTAQCQADAAQEQEQSQDQDAATARQQIEVWQAKQAQRITKRDNAIDYLSIYFTPPKFRDADYAEQARELGIELAPAEIPFYRHWHTYMYEELEESREIREQHDLLLTGKAKLDQVPAIKLWLDTVDPAMDALREAAAKPHFWRPVETNQTLLRDFRESHYIGAEINQIMESFRARSLFALADADAESAVRDCIAVDRFAKLALQFNDNNMIEDGPREARRNNKVLVHLLRSGGLTEDQLKRLADQWATAPRGPSSAEVFDRWERLWLIDYFERVASGDEQSPSFLLEQIFAMGGPVSDEEREGWDWMVRHELFDTKHAIKHINSRYDWLVNVLAKPKTYSEAVESLTEADRLLRARMRNMMFVMQAYKEKAVPAGTQSGQYTEQIVDGLLALLMHPNRVLDGPIDAYIYETRRAFGNTMIALARYRLAQGAYPDSLADLVPAYLDAVPNDPYEPTTTIRYRAETVGDGITLTLYSVGEDQADARGDDDDPTLTMITNR